MKTLLLGDFSPTVVTDPMFEKGEIDALFGDTLSLFKGNDVNFVNLECALTTHDKDIKKFGPPLKATPKVADVLREIGVNYCGISNNHFFDYGKQGALDTLENLDRVGIKYTGFGNDYNDSRRDLIINENGEKVAIIAVCEHEYSYALEDRMGCRPFCEFDTPLDIRKAKAEADRVIVIYHGGKEHCRYPSPRLIKACRAMAQSGADVVLCQHSHCIGCYENYEGTHILYGQGNFHFVKPDFMQVPDTWNGCLAVHYDTLSNEISFTPVVNTKTGIRLANKEEAAEMMSAFNSRNAELQNGEWKKGWHAFCESMSEFYTGVIEKAYSADATERDNAMFAHYLDCEAHTDVWRELNPTYNATNEK